MNYYYFLEGKSSSSDVLNNVEYMKHHEQYLQNKYLKYLSEIRLHIEEIIEKNFELSVYLYKLVKS
jgi:hypothetical protein